MRMSKKDYELIASIMRKRMHYASYDYDKLRAVEMTIEGLSDAFAFVDPKFNIVKFSRACWCPCSGCNAINDFGMK